MNSMLPVGEVRRQSCNSHRPVAIVSVDAERHFRAFGAARSSPS